MSPLWSYESPVFMIIWVLGFFIYTLLSQYKFCVVLYEKVYNVVCTSKEGEREMWRIGYYLYNVCIESIHIKKRFFEKEQLWRTPFCMLLLWLFSSCCPTLSDSRDISMYGCFKVDILKHLQSNIGGRRQNRRKDVYVWLKGKEFFVVHVVIDVIWQWMNLMKVVYN